jgi:hypothetical protein
MARKLKYGEETVLFARKIPKSHEKKIKLMVDSFLESVENEVKKKEAKKLPKKVKIVVPRSKKVDAPADIETESNNLIQGSKSGVMYPCGCFDDGEFHTNKECKYGDHENHKVFFSGVKWKPGGKERFEQISKQLKNKE